MSSMGVRFGSALAAEFIELAREQSTLAQLEAEVARQRILAQKQKLIARRDADEAGSPAVAEASTNVGELP